MTTRSKHKMFKIVIINHATVVSPEKFATMVAACADQLRGEFSAAWDLVPCDVEILAHAQKPDPNAYQMVVTDTSDQPGALGYHDTDEQGKPRGFVFAKTTMDDGEEVSVTLSHELMEMRLDPLCATWVMAADGKMRAYEACDAVEDTSYAKQVGDETVNVSNFLLPSYFAGTRVAGMATDYLDKLKGAPAPARTSGGYDIEVDTTGNITQETRTAMEGLSAAKQARKEHGLSRTNRRIRQAAA